MERTVDQARLGLAKQILGGGAVIPFLDEDAITTRVREWAKFVVKRLTNKDGVHLVQEPEAGLTPLILNPLILNLWEWTKTAQQLGRSIPDFREHLMSV